MLYMSQTLDIIQTVVSVAAVVLAVPAIFYGAYQLKSWRLQLVGTNEYELARMLLKSIYEVREAIRLVRSPFLSASEATGRRTDIPWEVEAYDNRMKELGKAVVAYREATIEAEVLWRKDVKDLQKELMKHIQEVRGVVRLYALTKTDKAFEPEFKKEQRDLLYEIAETDDFNMKLEKTIKKYEDYLSPFFAKR
jgi:hypothetical protein